MDTPSQLKTYEDLQAWMVAQVAAELGMAPQEIDVRKPLVRYGLDSMAAFALAGELEDRLGRSLPEDLLEQYPSIEALAKYLVTEPLPADSPAATELPQDNSRGMDPADLVRTPRRRSQQLFSKLIVLLLRLLVRTQVEGAENLPGSGAFILAGNHLHVFDPALLYGIVPPGTAFLVAEDMRRKWPIIEWVMEQLGPTIYVAREGADREAITRSVAWLRAGGRLAMAPEGKVSRTGGLLQGRTGIAYLAAEAGVPVLPVVAFGQEKASHCWKRIRRVPVQIRIGSLVELPAGKATARQLEAYTDQIMLAMARLLPPPYRGVYEQAAQRE